MGYCSAGEEGLGLEGALGFSHGAVRGELEGMKGLEEEWRAGEDVERCMGGGRERARPVFRRVAGSRQRVRRNGQGKRMNNALQ